SFEATTPKKERRRDFKPQTAQANGRKPNTDNNNIQKITVNDLGGCCQDNYYVLAFKALSTSLLPFNVDISASSPRSLIVFIIPQGPPQWSYGLRHAGPNPLLLYRNINLNHGNTSVVSTLLLQILSASMTH
ncbi:2137_t:CDS:2, partial [Paraglomus brasilianum]